MNLKNTLLTATALTPVLFSGCSSDINYLATANSFIPTEEAYAVKKAEMETSINSLSVTQARKAQLKQILNSFGKTSHGHHIVAGIQPHTQFTVSNNIAGVSAYSMRTNQVIIKNDTQAQSMNNKDWYSSVSHELLHSYQRNHALGLLPGVSPQQYMFILKLYEAEAKALEKFGDNLWSAGRTIKQCMAQSSGDLMWTNVYEPLLFEDLKRAATNGLLTTHGNTQAIQHTLHYFNEIYGIRFDKEDIERGGISNNHIDEFKSICHQIQASGVLESGNRDFAVRQQMAEKFGEYVEYATSPQAIINYFNAFCQIKPTHIEEAQILLDSENPFGIVALQTLIENGHIKGNLEELKTENEIKQQELKIVKQNVHSAWQAHKKQAQHTR